MLIIGTLVIICMIIAVFFFYGATQCEDEKGIMFFMSLAIVALLVGNIIGVLGIVYKLGGV